MDPDHKWIMEMSAGGFVFLAGWCWYLSAKYQVAANVSAKVDEIHLALMGTMDKEGLISKVRRMDDNCKLRHKDDTTVKAER